jgi:hypothetical protein
MNRRSFLIRSAGTVGALLTTQFLKDAQWLIANQEQALLVTPVQRALETLYAVPSEGKFALFLGGLPNEYIEPQFTWEEFGNIAWGYSEKDTLEYLRENYDLCKCGAQDRLNAKADDDLVLDWWLRHQSPNALAYKQLEGIDLGPQFDRAGKTAGSIRFFDSFHPGNETLWVEVPDLLSVSLLQARLNELEQGIRLEVLEGDHGLG